MCIFTFLNSVSMPIFYEWGQRLGHLEMIFHLSPNNKAVVKFGSLKFVREDPRLYREFIVAEPTEKIPNHKANFWYFGKNCYGTRSLLASTIYISKEQFPRM